MSDHSSLIIERDSVLKGTVSFDGILVLKGEIHGKIVHSRVVRVEENSSVYGPIEAEEVVIRGLVEGEVCAEKRVIIEGRGKLIGNIYSERMRIDDLAVFKGKFIHSREKK